MTNSTLAKKIKVAFLIAGTQKGGTTALNSYLNLHSEISMAESKEVHFFDNEENFVKTEVDYSIYHSFFSTELPYCLFGDATPIYMYWYPAPRRIWEYNPEMKWILILRNPIERAFSHWNMQRDRGWEKLAFLDAVKNERVRYRETLPNQHRIHSYVDRGFYTEQIRRIWHYFPVEQTLFLKTEELRNKPKNTLNKVYDFLGLERLTHVESKTVHSRKYTSQLTESEKNYLKHVYEFEIKELERMLGWNCSEWLNC